MKRQLILSLMVVCLGGWQEKAIAHGAKIEYQTAPAIEIQATYDSGTPMANAQVVVYAPDDPATPWMDGKTDEKGNFSFIPDSSKSGNWEVKVRQAGHGGIVTIAVDSLNTTDNALSEASTLATNEQSVQPNVILAQASSENKMPQRVVAIASVIWGFIGTALFFSRWKDKHQHPEDRLTNSEL
ncbi:MAG: carboxypeptidase-like regulatory domain-containing protein [Cyanobacteriota bacterium]|nr:carboxypeptidase-like regulatory domain-containing protein [Cyanobacteriota bacterium]